ncbi:MAG: oligosaccharide flippase family protein [bacterium]
MEEKRIISLKGIIGYASALYFVGLFSSFISFGVTLMLIKVITKEALGKLGFFVAFYTLGNSILSFGMERTIVKYVGEGRIHKAKIIKIIFLLTGIISIFTILGGIMIYSFNKLWAFSLLMITPCLFCSFSVSIFRGEFARNKEIKFNLVCSLLNSGITLILLLFFKNELAPILGQIFSYYICAIFLLFYLLSKVKGDDRCSINTSDWSWIKEMAKFSFPLWIAILCATANRTADKFILQGFLGFSLLGEYYLSQQFFQFIDKPIANLSQALLGGLSISGIKSLSTYQRLISFNLVLFPSVALLTTGILPVLLKILNKDFPCVAPIFALLSVCFVAKSIEVVNTVSTIVKNYPQANQNTHLITFLINIPTLLILVSCFGIYGAGFGVITFWFLYIFIHMHFMKKILPEYVSLGLRMCIKALLFYLLALSLIFKIGGIAIIPLGIAVYLFGSHWIGIWSYLELKAMMEELFKRKSLTKAEQI